MNEPLDLRTPQIPSLHVIHTILRLPGCLTLCIMQSKCGTSCEGGDTDSPIRFQRVETGKNRQKTIDDLKKRSPETFGHKKRLFKNLYRENFFPSPQTRSQVSAYDIMTIILQIVQTPSPVFFKSLRRCSRELGPVGDLVNLEFSYRRDFIGEKVIGDLGNRGLGPVGELGLGLQSETWACRGIGSIGDLVIGSFVIGDLGNGGLGQSGTWAIGELGLGLQSGTWACRGVGAIGDFVIGEFLSGKRLSGTWAIGLTSCSPPKSLLPLTYSTRIFNLYLWKVPLTRRNTRLMQSLALHFGANSFLRHAPPY